jgi:hypothetical protein
MDWVGAGRYERSGDQLTLNFEAWVRRGLAQKTHPILVLAFVGEGNTIQLHEASDDKRSILWKRAPL